MDIDSQQKSVYGHKKQGAGFGRTPLDAPVIAGTQLRGGTAHSARGAAPCVTEAVHTTRAPGCTGRLAVRMDSAFHSAAACGTARPAGAFFSATVAMTRT